MGLVNICRDVTATIKIFPFLYTPVYIAGMFGHLLFGEGVAIWLDTLFYVSVIFVLLIVRLSYCVKLCIWHRVQCCLPLFPQMINAIDSHLRCFEIPVKALNLWLAATILLLTVVNAYMVYIKPRRNDL